jgi:BirA family transcriptional regulator, biotin operon repressor / biotin---[acetyl-CoA-carboxylase] ligase
MIIGSKILFYESLPSTNSEAFLLIKRGSPEEGTVIYTDFQTAGRGQAGKSWESEKGRNLLISIILYPESVNPEDQFLISMMASMGICDLIDNYFHGTKIKWPNDIYAGNNKIAGILIENSIIGNKIGSSVIGTGLNINQTDFPEKIPNPVSLKMLTGNDSDRDIIMQQLLANLDIRYKQLLYGDRENLRNEYILHLYRYGEWHKYRSSGRSFTGRIAGVSTSGKLIIENRNGSVRDFAFREVDYLL